MQFHAHEAVNALKFRYQSLHAESNKWREIEWKRLLPALMEKRVVLDIVLIEVVRECVKAVAVISPLKEDACSNQPGHSPVSIVKGVDGAEKKVRHQGMDCRRETA